MRALLLSTLGVVLLMSAPASSAVTIDWAFVGNPGNACDPQSQGCFGAVGYAYNIATYEVTNDQYVEFLNAVAATDTNGLYNTSMGSGFGGITQTCAGSCTYSAIAGREDMPVNFVSFYDALRFANWLHNGQPIGAQDNTTTEDGAYTFSGPTTVGARNPGATVVLPSEDEWYKAAYYDSTTSSYFDYPAGSDTQTSCGTPTATANSANCDSAVGDVTIKGSYSGSASPYGTFDQSGNVWEWNEAIIGGSNRAFRGGSYNYGAGNDVASIRPSDLPASENPFVGFRVASIPEPAPLVIDWTTIGNPGNACDDLGFDCFGAVAYAYQIGTYEVTNAEYAEFLNDVASNDIHGLYSPMMGTGYGGIVQFCAPGGNAPCHYSVIVGRGDRPVSNVNWFDVLRFANWLHNGQPKGAQDASTTEDGAYTFTGHQAVGARNAGATIFLPSEDEWYKAAYYSPGGIYFGYPVGTDTQTVCAAPVGTANTANCELAAGSDLADVGSYPGSASPYGTFDQGGNVWEWTQTITGTASHVRGGSFAMSAVFLSAQSSSLVGSTLENEQRGFRVAPEPGSNLLLVAGVLSVFGLARWRRARD